MLDEDSGLTVDGWNRERSKLNSKLNGKKGSENKNVIKG